jgi:hypothetical protein
MVFSRIFLALDNAVESNFRNTQIVRFAVAAILLLGTGYLNRALATHNRAGEITYTHVSGLTFKSRPTPSPQHRRTGHFFISIGVMKMEP